MGYIYKVTNTINGKMYIGQTSRTIKARWNEHLQDAFGRDAKSRFPFHRAIQKYGKDAFKVEQIEKCDNSDLDGRERYWIKYYDTYKNGYNADFGGRSNKGHPIYQYALDGTFIRMFETLGDAQEAIGKTIMISSKKPNVSFGGYLWRRYKVDKLDVQYKPKEKSVHQYSIDGEYVATYSSLTEAAMAVRGRNTGTMIGAACRGEYNTVYGYRWSFDKKDRLQPLAPSKHLKKVVRISPDSGEKKIYDTIEEAAKDNNTFASNIISACKGRTKTCKGFVWEYYDSDNLENII